MPAPPPTDHGPEAKRRLEAAWKACPDHATAVGMNPVDKCEEADAVLAFEHWATPSAEKVLLDTLGTPHRLWAAILLNRKGMPHRSESAPATRLLDALEAETDGGVGMMLGTAVARIDLTGTKLADRVERYLLDPKANASGRSGVIMFVLERNRPRFEKLVGIAKADPNPQVADAAKMALGEAK